MAGTTPKSLEKRTRTAALRSLGMILDLAEKHRAALEGGEVPDAGFTASVTRYEESRAALMTLARFSDEAVSDDAGCQLPEGEVAVKGSDLEILVDALNEFVPPELLASAPGSPYYNVTAALSGEPQPGPASEESPQ